MSDCGCRTDYRYDSLVNEYSPHIGFCPLHEAAGQMLEALEQMLLAWKEGRDMVSALYAARAALAAARPEGLCPLNHMHTYACVGLIDFGAKPEGERP